MLQLDTSSEHAKCTIELDHTLTQLGQEAVFCSSGNIQIQTKNQVHGCPIENKIFFSFMNLNISHVFATMGTIDSTFSTANYLGRQMYQHFSQFPYVNSGF
jgi:hypothetical protein